MILAAAKSGSSGTSLLPILFIVVLFVLLYVVMIRPQRNRQRQAAANQRGVVPGQRIRTTAGIYGTVTADLGDDLELEVSPGVRIRIMRRAVLDAVPDEVTDPAGPQPDGTSDQAATSFGEPKDGEFSADELSKDRNSQDRI
jgi:preprotein translocase subunit YajC